MNSRGHFTTPEVTHTQYLVILADLVYGTYSREAFFVNDVKGQGQSHMDLKIVCTTQPSPDILLTHIL